MFRKACLGLLTLAMAATAAPASENILENGDFGDGKAPWVLFSNASRSDLTTGSDGARIRIGRYGKNNQLYQAPLPLDGNREYELSFYAAARPLMPTPTYDEFNEPNLNESTRDRDGFTDLNQKGMIGPPLGMLVAISQHVSPNENYGLKKEIELSPMMKKFVFRFTTTAGDKDDARLRFAFPFTKGPRGYRIANVVLRPLGCGDGILDEGEACDDGNNVDGDGCSGVCTIDCQVNLGDIDADASTLALFGAGLCEDPQVFVSDEAGVMVEVPVLSNDDFGITADLSEIDLTTPGSHRVVVVCPDGAKEIWVAND